MKTKLLVTSLLVSCALCSFAQAQENETKTFKHDIGFNTAFILQGVFNTNSSTPFTLMYKTYQNDKKALRFGVGGSFNVNDFNDKAVNSNYYNNSNISINISVGKEFQQSISQKWMWYSGGDIVSSYYSATNDYFQDNLKIQTQRNYNLGIGIRPFIGIRFNINSRLYLSAEASLTSQYTFSSQYAKIVNSNTVTSDRKGSDVSTSLSPASGLFLYYRF
jgi:hypothetical protein